jgi:NADPH:quinone reductase-like Zn-dependent oxidoreductase
MAKTMRALQASAFSIDALALAQREIPVARRGEILIKLTAASLNYRDLAILAEKYIPTLALPYVPGSDACGEVVAVGEDVTRFKVGERVIPIYTQGWYDGYPTPEMRTKRTLGAPLSGVLQEYIAVPAEDAVAAPAYLTDQEAATLPIAALTAWSTLQEGGLKPGDTVLVQGTGGVAMFALQFAKLAGARVVCISSSDHKLEQATQLGADVCINYRSTPAWEVAVKEATGGRGVDIVVETSGSLQQSLASVRFGGFIGVVGFVGGYTAEIALRAVIGPMIRIQGIAVGSRARFEAMNRALEQHRVRPMIDSAFPLADGAKAFRHMKDGKHFGKIVIDI